MWTEASNINISTPSPAKKSEIDPWMQPIQNSKADITEARIPRQRHLKFMSESPCAIGEDCADRCKRSTREAGFEDTNKFAALSAEAEDTPELSAAPVRQANLSGREDHKISKET